jgi:hypothetical protein
MVPLSPMAPASPKTPQSPKLRSASLATTDWPPSGTTVGVGLPTIPPSNGVTKSHTQMIIELQMSVHEMWEELGRPPEDEIAEGHRSIRAEMDDCKRKIYLLQAEPSGSALQDNIGKMQETLLRQLPGLIQQEAGKIVKERLVEFQAKFLKAAADAASSAMAVPLQATAAELKQLAAELRTDVQRQLQDHAGTVDELRTDVQKQLQKHAATVDDMVIVVDELRGELRQELRQTVLETKRESEDQSKRHLEKLCLLEAQLSHQTSELSSVSARVFDELSAVRLRGDHASQQAAAATQQVAEIDKATKRWKEILDNHQEQLEPLREGLVARVDREFEQLHRFTSAHAGETAAKFAELEEAVRRSASRLDYAEQHVDRHSGEIVELRGSSEQLQKACAELDAWAKEYPADQFQYDLQQMRTEVQQLRTDHVSSRTGAERFQRDLDKMKDSCEQIRDDNKQMNKVMQQSFEDIARVEEFVRRMNTRINMRNTSAGAISDLDMVVDPAGTFAVENIASFSMSWDRSERSSRTGSRANSRASSAGSRLDRCDRILGKDHGAVDRIGTGARPPQAPGRNSGGRSQSAGEHPSFERVSMLAPNSIGARPPSSLERPASAGHNDPRMNDPRTVSDASIESRIEANRPWSDAR